MISNDLLLIHAEEDFGQTKGLGVCRGVVATVKGIGVGQVVFSLILMGNNDKAQVGRVTSCRSISGWYYRLCFEFVTM